MIANVNQYNVTKGKLQTINDRIAELETRDRTIEEQLIFVSLTVMKGEMDDEVAECELRTGIKPQ